MRSRERVSKTVPENVAVFDQRAEDYDRWFSESEHVYGSELEAVRTFIPGGGSGVEIGVGTGRFAAPLGIEVGVEPAEGMAGIARPRGIEVHEGRAEDLPFADGTLDFVLLVTVICFVEDAAATISTGSATWPRGVLTGSSSGGA